MAKTHTDCPPGDVADERLALPVEQGVLLWCMRALVIEMKRGLVADRPADELLAALGAPSASPCLKAFMSALSRGCTRLIEVQCVCCRRISPDERALLDVLALSQAMRPFEALLLLRGFMTQVGADAALGSAEEIGLALAQAGRFLPEPEEEVRHFALSSAGWGRLVEATLH